MRLVVGIPPLRHRVGNIRSLIPDKHVARTNASRNIAPMQEKSFRILSEGELPCFPMRKDLHPVSITESPVTFSIDPAYP